MINYKKTNLKGFTLIELMVVIAIIGIMTTVSITSLHLLKTRASLKSAQSEVSATIKTARSYALQGKKQSNIVCGYGFRFTDKNNYEIFYNILSTSMNDCDEQNSSSSYLHHRNAYSFTFFKGKLPDGVSLKTPAFNNTEIFFTLPHASVYNKDGNSFTGKTFVFQMMSKTKQIVINKQTLITAN